MWIGNAVAGAFKRKGGPVADLGTENKLYYNEELKAWVEKGQEEEVRKQQEAAAAPPVNASVNLRAGKSKRDLTSRYTLPDNLKVASGPSSNDLSPNVFAPVPTAPSPAGPPKFFIPKPAQQQQTAAGFSENRYPSYSDPSPSPVSVLDAHKSGGGTDTDDSRPSSAFEATAAAGPALSAPAALDGTAAGPSPSEVTTAAAPAVQATEDDASSAPLPAAPEAAEAAPEAAPAASEGASDGLHLYRAPAAGARSSTMDTAGSSISVEEHQANTAKMLSKWLPDRSMGKISPLPWEEDFAYSSSAAASSSYHPMFAWDTASKAGMRSTSVENRTTASADESEQRHAKSQRTSIDNTSAAAQEASSPAPPPPASQASMWGPHSASSIYSPTSIKGEASAEAVISAEPAEQGVDPTPMSKPSYPQYSSHQQHQQQDYGYAAGYTAAVKEEAEAEAEAGAKHEGVRNLDAEGSWESSQGTFHMPAAADPETQQEAEQQEAASSAEQQPKQEQQEQRESAVPELSTPEPSADATAMQQLATPEPAGTYAAMDPEGSYGYDGYYTTTPGLEGYGAQEQDTAAAYYGGVAIGTDEAATAGAASADASVPAAVDGAYAHSTEQQQEQQAADPAAEFAPWSAIVSSMNEAGFASDPAMQSYMAYFVQYGNFLITSLPNKEALVAQLAQQLPAPAAPAAEASAAAQANGSVASADMAVVLEGASSSKAAEAAAAEAAEADGGMWLSDEDLAAFGEMELRHDVMEAILKASGIEVGMLLECL